MLLTKPAFSRYQPIKGRTIRKVMGGGGEGGGKNQKKNSCKEVGKKKIMQKEGQL